MQLSQIPAKFQIPFGASAGGSFINYPIPEASQISITPGAASLTDGFPPLNFTPVVSGGIPPRGVDFNGLLFQSTSWDRWTSAGGPIFYDSVFQAACGGYPQYAVVRSIISPYTFWESTTDNNVTNPDAGGAGWIQAPWSKQTGDIAWRPVAAVLPGHVILNGTTMGKASSGATQASDTYLFAYQYLWNNFSNTQCPVSTGRGANATADFNAGKTIGTLDMKSIGIIGMDNMLSGSTNGLLTNVPAVSGSATLAGSILGENLHTLIAAEMAILNYTGTVTAGTNAVNMQVNGSSGNALILALGGTVNQNFDFNNPIGTAASGNQVSMSVPSVAVTVVTSAGNGAHNNVERSMTGVWFMHI